MILIFFFLGFVGLSYSAPFLCGSVSSAWIGLYDPNKTQQFGVVNPSRFEWVDGSVLSYQNWENGQPDNLVITGDTGVVSVLGEHWAYMDSNGKWFDDGYHQIYGGDYTPRRYALVAWNGPLDCVNGVSPQNDVSDYQDSLINNVCNGETPCYACASDNGVFQCDAGLQTFDYKGQEISIGQYSGEVIISAGGTIDYCFDYQNSIQGCPRSGIDAVKAWIVFIGDVLLNTLQHTQSNNTLTVTVPDGVRLTGITDVETLSGQCTSDNKYSLTVSIQPAYLCPENRVQCGALNEDPICPDGILNPERNMCQTDADIVCPVGYTWDSEIDKCTKQVICDDNGVFNPDTDRCEKAVILECPAGYTLDQANRVCYKPIDCGTGVYNPSRDRCEYSVTYTCPSGYTLSGTTCYYAPPSCISGTSYSNTYDLCIADYTNSCPSGYTWTGQRCETTNIICPQNYVGG